MSLKTKIQNLRADLKIRQETANAQNRAGMVRAGGLGSIRALPFVLMFMSLLAMLAVAPVSAEIDLNGTLGPIINDIVDLIPDLVNLIVALVPAVLVLSIVGFVIAFLDKILSLLKL